MAKKDKTASTFTRREVLAGSAVAVAAAGCPGPLPEVDAGPDAGVVGGDGGSDAGRSGLDGGETGPDAGNGLDAGQNGADAGPDGGVSADAGADGGFDPADGGQNDAGADDAGADDAGFDPDHPASVIESADFALGVASGPGQTEGAMLWTHYAGANDLALCVWPYADPAAYTLAPVLPADLSTLAAGQRAFVARADLLEGERYGYTFLEVDGDTWLGRSDVGQLRIPESSGANKVVRIGAHSCTNVGETNFNVVDAAGSLTDLDAYILVGDTVYADDAMTRAEYDQFWASAFATQGYRGIRKNSLLLATWDDHEVDNNWNPETFDAVRLADATGAFFEHQPIDPLVGAPTQIWRSQRFGDVLEVFVLDCRSERLPSTRETANAQYISPAQMTWLKDGLATSSCTFKLIVNSVPIADQPLPLGAADQWSGYVAQRDEILDHIDAGPFDGVIWLAGDVHMSASGRVGAPGNKGENQIEIISSGAAKAVGNPRAFLYNEPQWDWATAQRAFVTFAFDPATGNVTVTHRTQNLEVLSEETYTIATV